MNVRTILPVIALLVAPPVLAQCPDGTPPPCHSGRAAAPAPPGSIAVLYFDNLSRDTEDVYLADGFTEEVMSRLGQVERLQVKSRTAVQRLRGHTGDPLAAGRSLGVAHLVSGSVLKQAGRIRVTVELTRISTGNSVWGRSFDRSSADLIRTEAEIAESVAVNVGARLAPAEIRRIEARPTRNPAAYDHLLRGRFEMARRTSAGFIAAARQFETAVQMDSMMTAAWLGVAAAYGQLAILYYSPELGIPRDSLLARSRGARERALRQDSTSSEALVSQSSGMDAAQAEPLLMRALAVDPRNPEAHHVYALTLRQLGQDSAAVREFKRALEIDPERAISLANLGQTYLLGGRFAEGMPWIDSAVALRPEAAFYYLEQALGRLHAGDTAGARAAAELTGAHGGANGREEILAMIQARAGDSAGARARAARIDSALQGRECLVSHDCLELGIALASVGSRDRALAVVERLMPRSYWAAYWLRRPEFDAIRSDPRFQQVLAESRAMMRR